MDYIGFITEYERKHGKSQAEMAVLLGIGSYQNYQTLKKAKTISHEVIRRIDELYEKEKPPDNGLVTNKDKYTTTLEKLVSKYESENEDLKRRLDELLVMQKATQSSLAELKDTAHIVSARALANHDIIMKSLSGEKQTLDEMRRNAHKLFFSKLETYEQSGIRVEADN